MKETGTAHWNSPNQDATNISGFTGIPSAYRLYNGTFIDDGGCKGYWWSSSEFDTTNAWLRYLSCSIGGAMRGSHYKKYGFSVRCLKD